MPRLWGLIPAAGVGARFGAGASMLPKQYAPLAGETMLHHSIRALLRDARIEQVFTLLAPADVWWASFDWREFGAKLQPLFVGGETRAHTVTRGVASLGVQPKDADWLLVHDAARPCLSAAALARLIDQLEGDDVGGLLALPLTDTLKRANDSGHRSSVPRVQSTEARERLWRAQTPQMFRYGVLARALEAAPSGVATDESWAVEQMGLRPRLVEGELTNLKVTFPTDLAVAEIILNARGDDAHRPRL